MVVLDEINIPGSSINQTPTSTMSVATFVKKNSCLVAGIVSFDTAGLHPLTLCFLEPFKPKRYSRINGIIIVPFKSYLNQCI